MKNIAAALLLILFCALPALPVDRSHINDLNQQARKFAQQKDWASLREVLLQIGNDLGTPTPFHMLRMASVEARLGHTEAALQWMSRYAATSLTYDVSSDDDLKPLLSEKAYSSIAAKMKEHSQPVMKAETVCSLPLLDLMPEDLTYEPASKTFIVSSVQHHTIYRVSQPSQGGKECGLHEVTLGAANRRWPTFAVTIDSAHNLIWATIAAAEGFAGVTKEDAGKTALLAIDPTTGQVAHRFDLASGSPALLGDMSVAPDDAVYVTDSIGGGVYRLRGDLRTAKLEQVAAGLFSPQTPVLAKDGKRLFVADYSIGIALIDLESHKVDYLRHPENIAVTGLDGLSLAGDSLLGVQNGTDPERIVRYQLNSPQTEIVSEEIIEQGPRIGDPTHVIVVDGVAYVSANVGWNKVDDQGKLKAGQQFTAPVLMRFPVK